MLLFMEASAAQVAEFGRVLSAQIAGRNRIEFAQAVSDESGESVSDAAISQYTNGRNEPSRAKVFAMERVLGLRGGTLSRCLGYLPVDAKPARTLADVLDSDGALDERGRRVLLAMHRELRG